MQHGRATYGRILGSDTVALLTGRLHIPTFNIEASVGHALVAAARGSPIRMALPYVKDGESAVHLRSKHLNSLLRL